MLHSHSLFLPLLRFTIFKTCSANAQPDYITWCNKTPRPTDCRTLIQRFYPDASNFLVKTESYFQVMAASAAYYAATDAHKLLFYTVNDGKFKTKTESEKARWKNCYQYIRAAQGDLLYARSAFNASLALKSLVKAPGHVAECERQFTDKGIRDALTPKLDTLKKSIETAIAINNNTSLSKTGRKLLEKHQNRVVVAQDGSGNYRSIQEAVNAASRRPVNGRFEIFVNKGCYNEQVKVEGPHAKDITIVGDGIGNTVITGDKHVQSKKQHTSETAVICVKAPGFIAKFITFATMGGPSRHQAVALKSESNQSVYYKCKFEGYQDTLYLYLGLQFFRECDTLGSMDTIFGDSTAVFQNCNIFLRKQVGNEVVVTGQKRSRDDNTGFVIQNSRVTLTDELRSSLPRGVKVFLGRPWGKYSRTVYIRTYLAQGINPQGWTYMDEMKDGNFVDYAEFENTGPGANTADRIKWRGVKNINRNEASKLTVRNFLQGGSWIASAGIPYSLDL